MNNKSDPVFWNKTSEELLSELQSSSNGLTENEAENRLEKFGRNSVEDQKRKGLLSLFLRQFVNPLVLILIAAAILSLILYDATDAIIILFIVLVSGLLGFWQEKKAAKAIESLEKMIQLQTNVLREGSSKSIPLEFVVPGDILLLKAGDIVPADSVPLETKDLFVDEAVLTGECFPVDKEANQKIEEKSHALFMGTHVVSGTAKAIAVRTGKQTEFGKIAEHLWKKAPLTEFESGVRRFGFFLMALTLLFVAAIFIFNLVLHRPLLESFLFSLAIAVGLTPQLLPAIITVNLAHGAKKMADRAVIVRKLVSLENFGSMDILCADKTGTLTEGTVAIHATLDAHDNENEKVLLYSFINASFQTAYSNPIDQSILNFKSFDLKEYQKLDEIPFDFERKRIAILSKSPEGNLLVIKGAFHHVLPICTSVEIEEGKIVPISETKEEIEKIFEKWASQGFRIIGLAYRLEKDKEKISREDEKEMIFLGFILFMDPLKGDIKETIKNLKDFGISLRILTGDNALVAKQIAGELGLSNSYLLTGKEIETMSEEDLREKIKTVTLFAEIDPEQKEKIIKAYRKNGHVVGYMGDGVNDSAALHNADVGISVNTATDVVKGEADIILLKKDLSVLLEGVKEGRKTFGNTMKYIFMATSANFGNMFSMAGASLFLPFLPLLPKQVLLTNLLTDFPEMTICTDRIDEEMERKPSRFSIKFIAAFMVVFGLISTIFDYLTFGVLLFYLKASKELFRSGWFVESVVSASLIVLVIRTRRPFFKSRPSIYLTLAIFAICLLTIWIPYSPLKKLLGFESLPASFLLFIAVIIAIYFLFAEIAKHFFYKKFQP